MLPQCYLWWKDQASLAVTVHEVKQEVPGKHLGLVQDLWVGNLGRMPLGGCCFLSGVGGDGRYLKARQGWTSQMTHPTTSN